MASNAIGQDYSLGDDVPLDGPASNPGPRDALSALPQSALPPTANPTAMNSPSALRDWTHRETEREFAAAQQEEASRVLGSPAGQAGRSSGILSPRNSRYMPADSAPIPSTIREAMERADDACRMPPPPRPRARSRAFPSRSRHSRQVSGSDKSVSSDGERTLRESVHDRSSPKAPGSRCGGVTGSTASGVAFKQGSRRHSATSNVAEDPSQTIYDWTKWNPWSNTQPITLNPSFNLPPGTVFVNGRFGPDPDFPDDDTLVDDSISSEPARPQPFNLAFVPRHSFAPDCSEIGSTSPGWNRSRNHAGVHPSHSWYRSQPLADAMTEMARDKLRGEGPWLMDSSRDRRPRSF